MKSTCLFFIGVIVALSTAGQTFNLKGGTSISKLDWELTGISADQFYDETLPGYSFFIGLDYLDMKYLNLSSNIGIVRKGGKGEFQLTNENGELIGRSVTVRPTLDYLSFNTSFDLKYGVKEKFFPFLGVGPRLDYLLSSSEQFDGLVELGELNDISAGLIFKGGLKYGFSSFQIGLCADYYLDLTQVADWSIESTGVSGEVSVSTFAINLLIGYRLK